MQKTIMIENTAQGYLELLRARGIKYFFGNAGTDFASLVDAFAKFAAEGKESPQPITVPHEFCAVSMAHGYYMITGHPQVVMVHVIVGTANASGAIMNAARADVPILFTAGRTPLTEAGFTGSRNVSIHWAQESFDQGSLVREFVKWDYELRNFAQLETVVDRALAIAMTEPRGPVYLTLPREVLAETQEELTISTVQRQQVPGPLSPDPTQVGEVARHIAQAEFPLIITAAAGRKPQTVEALIAFAESFAIPVVVGASNMYLNFPTSHPLHLGFDTAAYLPNADVVLVVDSDVPWFPAAVTPKKTARIIQLGADPLYSRYPVRGYPVDIALSGDPTTTLRLLTQALAPYQGAAQEEIRSRFEMSQKEHDRQRQAWRDQAEAAKAEKPIQPAWLSACINQVKDAETILVNEYDLMSTQVDLTVPGSFFGNSPAAALRWGIGAALGAKLAAPEKTVIATVGDGSYIFSVPTACHFVSSAYALPILVVIFNNQCWGAVRHATRSVHPQGWAVKTNHFPFSELSPSPAYEMICQAYGGYGERVEEPSEVLPALQRALRVVKAERRQAVLNVICKHP
ncbi:MAG: thiamine pyrophosphate-requiring protein [Candidatus Poribacteria bacterium]|nr:thiamine pyrophosphate-requiring protein [Candidatus Poribacteria bacterium]